MIALLAPMLALLRPFLPYLIAAGAILALLGGFWLAGDRHAAREARETQQEHQIEVLKQEKAGDEAATDARRDGAVDRLLDKKF